MRFLPAMKRLPLIKEQPLNAPSAISSITGMPNPKARRAVSCKSIQLLDSKLPSEPIENKDQTSEQAQVANADQEAHVLERKALEYPVESLRKGEEGSVIIRVRISAEGKPSDADIDQSSGFRNLDKAARKAVMRWTFAPKIVNGTAVDSEILVPVDFKLGN